MTGGWRWFTWAALAYAVIIAAVAIGLGRLYRGSHERLDEALGERLLAVAVTAAEMTDARTVLRHTLGDSAATDDLVRLQERFAVIARQQNLAEITLTNELDRRVIVSTTTAQMANEPNDYLALDAGAVEAALAGTAVATRLYDLGGAAGLKQKSAHAPVYSYVDGGRYVLALVTVSGSPDFFDSLDDLKRGAYLTAAAVVLILLLMGVFLWRINLALARYRASIQRQENLAAMGRMTAGIAHEIRNPLGIIRGAGQHLQRVLAEQGITDEVADFIPEEVDRLDHILTGYLAFGSDRDVRSEVFDLGPVLRRSAQVVREELTGRGVSLSLPDEWPAAPVKGDPRRLQQVVLNLLLNAGDAMPEGGQVAVDLVVGAGCVRAAVTDEGTGLAGISAAKLFEPFWTSKEKGSGLGLAMSLRIMEDMGGGLSLRDRRDRPGAVAELWAPQGAQQPEN